MKVSDIVTELNELEQKRDEINTVLVERAFGEPRIILQSALERYQKKVDTFLDAEFVPFATVIFISATPNPLTLDVTGAPAQLTVMATFSNGQSKDVSKAKLPMMFFRDFDKLTNNMGVITSVDIGAYTGEETTFEVVKTNNGFDVDDSNDTQGLQVVPTANTNEFQIVDVNGNPIGVTFVTNGSELTGDNWLIDIYWANTGTVYSTDNPGIATVSNSGLVTAVGGGTANLIIRNGLQEVKVPVTVADTIAPEPPNLTSVASLSQGASLTFDPSISPDTTSYNVYVDGVKSVTGVIYDGNPATVTLTPADGVISYTITMTAVDSSGNESVQSNGFAVTPTV